MSNYSATISARDAASLFPRLRQSKKIHIATLIRWHKEGVKLANGTTVKLWLCRIGNCWATSPEAVTDFIRACNPEDESTTVTTELRTPTARQQASEQAEKELEAAGL